MAKPKGKDIVGWSTDPRYEEFIKILAEWDVNQVKNRKSGQGQTLSSGHQPRQVGLAARQYKGAASSAKTYHIYSHSQVSNGAYFRYQPPAFVGMTRDDLSRLWMEIGKELFGKV